LVKSYKALNTRKFQFIEQGYAPAPERRWQNIITKLVQLRPGAMVLHPGATQPNFFTFSSFFVLQAI
jgi:hypothetical protein